MLFSERRFSSRVLLPVAAAIVTVAVVVSGLLLYTTRESDRIVREREARLLDHVLSDQFAKITKDQQSVSIWDESITRIRRPRDLEWMDQNVGIWLHDYFGHDEAYVLDGANDPIYVMAAGRRLDPMTYAIDTPALAPLIARMRADLAAHWGTGVPDSTELAERNLRIVRGRPAVVSVVPILSDTGRVTQELGDVALHVSMRYLDRNALDGLLQRYLIDEARFSRTADAGPDEAVFPLKSGSGAVLGYVVWRPDRPGLRIMAQTAPVLVGALLVVSVVLALLMRRLTRAAARLRTSEAQAQHLSVHDPLTGLANRTRFNEQLDLALADSRRRGSKLAVHYLDLDRFKHVNDTLGHPAGDDLIRELAQRLVGAVRSTDCVARLGGDEFAILQANVDGSGDVRALCDRVIQAVGRPFDLLGASATIGVSIGVAVAPGDGGDRAELVRKADIALYRAKAEGRNRYSLFTPEMDESLQRRRALENDLRAALAGNQLDVVYQPFFATSDQSLVGVEALLRWSHPKLGPISPAVFVPVAEEAGLVDALGEWVLRRACATASRWRLPRIAVNVSPLQFRGPNLPATVLRILEETGLAAKQLELEITENVLLDSADHARSALSALRAAGVRIALDDFGMGYSSLNYLQKYPVERIKIDRSFVQNIGSGSSSDGIVCAMIDLARALGLEVTAEGVETAEQRDFLRAAGCDDLQGFFLSRPLSKEQMEDLLGAARHVGGAPIASAA